METKSSLGARNQARNQALPQQPSLFGDLPLRSAANASSGTTSQKILPQAKASKRKASKRRASKRKTSAISGSSSNRGANQSAAECKVEAADHLEAAQKLAKKLRRAPRKLNRQKTGIAICQHLVALLRESDEAQSPQIS